jgi:hypothetical protein
MPFSSGENGANISSSGYTFRENALGPGRQRLCVSEKVCHFDRSAAQRRNLQFVWHECLVPHSSLAGTG